MVYTDSGSGWEEAESEVIGSYLCFSMTGSGRFSVTPADRVSWEIWAGLAGGCGAVLLIVILCLIGKKKRRRKQNDKTRRSVAGKAVSCGSFHGFTGAYPA